MQSILVIFLFLIISFNSVGQKTESSSDVRIAGAMKNVMWKGELAGVIKLDTLLPQKGLYGLGPLSYLKGELLIVDGEVYVSKVISKSEMKVERSKEVSAPFFVYAHVNDWREVELPKKIKSISDLEQFVNQQTENQKRPFAFKLIGEIRRAIIHIQNLPEGSQVSSPQEAHKGQVNYELGRQKVTVVGFFSTEHQGIFTHHDSFVHLHLVNNAQTKMGHLDEVEFINMKLYLPKK